MLDCQVGWHSSGTDDGSLVMVWSGLMAVLVMFGALVSGSNVLNSGIICSPTLINVWWGWPSLKSHHMIHRHIVRQYPEPYSYQLLPHIQGTGKQHFVDPASSHQ